MFDVECSAITYIGLVREKNEDNYYVNGKYRDDSSISTEGFIDNASRNSYLYAICDGMGGEAFGDLASLIAVKTLLSYQDTDLRQTITEYIDTTNRLICDAAKNNGNVKIGTTLALLFLVNNNAYSYNIGDSRIYLFRDGNLYLMTEDHTEAQRLVRMGIIKQEDVKSHKSKNKLTQHLGIDPNEMIIEPYVSEGVNISKNDIFLICSDGLTDMVSDDEIAVCLSDETKNTTDLVKVLAAKTQSAGSKDNATIIIIKVS